MKKYGLYVIAVVILSLLYYFSEQWEGSEVLFAILNVILFAVAAGMWKKYSTSGFGLVFLTAFGLFMLNSTLYLLAPVSYTIVLSLVYGLILIAILKNHHEAVMAAWWVVVFNILVNFAPPNEALFWFTLGTAGIGALVGFYRNSILFKRLFTSIFLFLAASSLLLNLLTKTYFSCLLMVVLIVILFIGANFFKNRAGITPTS